MTAANSLSIIEVKQRGVIYRRENSVELYLVIGKWNPIAKRPNHHWYMISDKTGMHMVTTTFNTPDERVNAHWEGFKSNQLTK